MEFVLLAVIVIIGWGVWFALMKRKVNNVTHCCFSSVYFLSLSSLVCIAYWDRLRDVFLGISTGALWMLFGLFVFNVLVYEFSRRFLKRPDTLIRENPEDLNLLMDYRYMFSKSFDILFQQLFITVLLLLLISAGLSLPGIIIIFIVLFGTIHIPGIWALGRFFGTYYAVFAVCSGFMFPLVFVSFHDGLVYNYMIHWLFYILSGLAFWIIFGAREAEKIRGEGKK